MEQTTAVLKHYEGLGKIKTVDANKDPETVYAQVRSYFTSFATRKKPEIVA